MTPQPLLKNVIPIKEYVSTSDYVLSLAEAVSEEGAAVALMDYVVTERLLDNFDEALNLIKVAIDSGKSRASYLHGSFGSGKSHFMAVLHALLRENGPARARQEFDPTLTKHEWLGTDGKRFLLVPYHMLGAKSLEQRVLGGYVRYVKKLHPDAPTPQVYRTDALFADIRAMRARMGDQAVLNGLATAGDADADDDWGDSFAWTSELLDAALAAEESHDPEAKLNLVVPTTPVELRAKLVGDASTSLLPGFAQNAAEDEHGFISLDAGLSVIAEHAKALGYDGLILFLDELVLWLATLIHDQRFVHREASKITNFVEGANEKRAIPIVSFIARQRDLRELVGEEVSGAAEASIQGTLNLVSGRFSVITLEDRNLPQIAHERLLRPYDGKQPLIDAAFAQTKRVGPQVWATLLGSDKSTTGADEESFRLTYPFSPAFMDTLVHISSALQRSRTGLKLMGQLLADHRDDLSLGQLVPLGDLYPVIAEGGDRPFVDSLKVVFESADKLYRTKLRPYLLASYNVTEDDIDAFTHRPETVTNPDLAQRAKQFIGDNRLISTLLLSALAPSVPALSDLTIRRLGALNYGSVTAPIPGAEVGIIKNKVADWAARFPEIKETGTELNPGVRLELTGVDLDSVLANAAVNDNPGNRAALARKLLAEELGIELKGQLGGDDLNLAWRGADWTAEVIFGNVADEDELPDHDLQPHVDGQWRIIVDLPYDEGDYGPPEDVNRMRELRDRQGVPARAVAWIPAHLSAKRLTDFKQLVIIDKALEDDGRFAAQYAVHLNEDNRGRAKSLLQSQREALLKQVKAAFKQAYGLADKKETDVELGFDEHLVALPDVSDLTVSIGQPMREAIRHIAGKLLAHQFPAHPDLDPEGTGVAVKPADAKTVLNYVRAAVADDAKRFEIPAKDRKLMRRLAVPLGLGEQTEAHFEPSTRWSDHFRQLARTRGATGDLSLITLLDWIDQPDKRGLEPFVANLVVAAFAEVDDRVWVRGGTVLDPAPELSQIKQGDPLALRSIPHPSTADWEEARRRYETIFGDKAPAMPRGRLVTHFARQITNRSRDNQESAAELVRQLEHHADFLGLDQGEETGRLEIARRSLDLLKALAATEQNPAKKTIETLAQFDLGPVSPDRYGTSIKQAPGVARALAEAAWDTLELAEGQGVEGQALLESLRGTARADQRTADLVTALSAARREVTALVKRNQPQPPIKPVVDPPAPMPPVTLPPVTVPGSAIPRSGGGRTRAATAAAELTAALAKLAAAEPDAIVEVSWRVVDQ